MSLFSEWLEDLIGGLEDVETDEITWLCEDPVFRTIADYCARSRGWKAPSTARLDDATFDADELGIDPEEDD